jgi:cold shock CspA family protein
MKGRIKFFDKMRGYGFIEPLGGGRDVMLHAKVIRGAFAFSELQAGTYVDADVEERGAGLYATKISLVFTVVDLPEGNLHRWAVKHIPTGIVEMFMHDEAARLIEWMASMALKGRRPEEV